jgi:DHA3 family tetracycline resistance protein-like MFS transporter
MNAFPVFLLLSFCSALFFSLIFTVNLVYQVTIVGLDPLQLVLVGTVLEATIFIFEIPTGVVADVKSRRLSIIIGTVLTGLGFVIEGSLPFFLTVALGQMIWGFGHTFTSGATQAWIVDEIGQERAGQAFLRGAQARQIGHLIGIPLSVALASWTIQLPIILGGALMSLLGIFLILTMPEKGFKPVPNEERDNWGAMWTTVKAARRLTRRQPIIITILTIGLIYGLYSEGVDRLWTAHLLDNFTLPPLGRLKPVVWFGIIRMVGLTLGLAGTEIARRGLDTRGSRPVAMALSFCAGLMIAALAGFALTDLFWLALVLFWIFGAFRSVTGPLYDTWLNQRIDDSSVRATVFSVSGQADAIGQVAGGPMVGMIGKVVSIRAALLSSALLLSPALPLYGLTIKRNGRPGSPNGQPNNANPTLD